MIERALLEIRKSILRDVKVEIRPQNKWDDFASHYKDEKGWWVVVIYDIVVQSTFFNQKEIDWIFLHEIAHIIYEDHKIPQKSRNIEHEYRADKWASDWQNSNEYGILAIEKFKIIIHTKRPIYDCVDTSIFILDKRIDRLNNYSY